MFSCRLVLFFSFILSSFVTVTSSSSNKSTAQLGFANFVGYDGDEGDDSDDLLQFLKDSTEGHAEFGHIPSNTEPSDELFSSAIDLTKISGSSVSSPVVEPYIIGTPPRGLVSLSLMKLDSPLVTGTTSKFEELEAICVDNIKRSIPRHYLFMGSRSPEDYLALAIRARDPDAIIYITGYVDFVNPSQRLQSALINLIYFPDFDIFKALGLGIDDSFSMEIRFSDPFHYFGLSLFRIALEQGCFPAANYMVSYLDLNEIVRMWDSLKEMRLLILFALEESRLDILTKFNTSEFRPVFEAFVNKILMQCIKNGKLKALIYLYEQTKLSLCQEIMVCGRMTSTMFYATALGHYDIVQFLGNVEPHLYSQSSGNKLYPIHAAAYLGHHELISHFLDRKKKTFEEISVGPLVLTPYSIAIRRGHKIAAAVILNYRISPNDSSTPRAGDAPIGLPRSVERFSSVAIASQFFDVVMREMHHLLQWAIEDGSISALKLYLGFIDLKKHLAMPIASTSLNVLELALRGPQLSPKLHSMSFLTFDEDEASVPTAARGSDCSSNHAHASDFMNNHRTHMSNPQCLNAILRVWTQHGPPLAADYSQGRSSLLASVCPNDLLALRALIDAGIDVNEEISWLAFEDCEKEEESGISAAFGFAQPVSIKTTFLHIATEQGGTEILRDAVKARADPRTLDSLGRSVMDIAAIYKNDFALEFFAAII